jgi:PucR family transcriptional regulator, purine catabolism regulatory protein
MAITLAALLANSSLSLRSVGQARGAADEPIRWVAVTELEDPLPFLSGGEVVLTTGLRQKTAAAQRSFVDRVHRAGAVAIGFAVGLSHAKVPAAFVAEADALGLPVFEVPYETPFVAISKLVADAISADHYARLEGLLKRHQVLASALLGGGGLAALLQALAGMLHTDVALFQYGAQVFSTGTAAPDAASSNAAAPAGRSWHKLPIATGLKDRCTLAIAEPYERDAIVDYAQSLVSVELNNQAQRRSSERMAAGQVLQDIARGTLTGHDATLRLGTVGIDSASRQLVLMVDVASGQRRALKTLPLPAVFNRAVTAVLDDRLVIVVADAEAGPGHPGQSGSDLGQALSDYLYGAGLTAKVGVGGAYAQPSGLRWSYFEAKEALHRGQRLNVPERLSLTSLLLASEDVPLADLAAEALDPLVAYDEKNDAGLLATLEAYLELNGSVAAVADTLRLHRNTVRYRLQQIVELTGYNPAVTAGRVHLWLALSIRKMG